ncbi:MAG TPA: hypothetical protein VHS97_03550, partial [Isosphaeraceae bacterium]|nr:hypothetical protein [Isosphaeraceae bacterium]
MIAFAMMAVAAWWLVDQPKRRGKAIATTKRAGGFVQFDDEYNPERLASPPSPISLVGLSDKWLGPEFAHGLSVVSVDGQPISEDDLTNLERVEGLRRLYLNGTPITDAGMAHLGGL